MEKISVLLVDDHPVVRQGLIALLETEPDLVVIEEADNGRAAVALAQKTRPDVVVMDVSMPLLNGAEATRQIRKTVPGAKVLVLSSYADDEFVEHLMQAGAAGYLTKETATNDLAGAIRAVHTGKSFFSSAISRRLRHRYSEPVARGQPMKLGPELTSRQVEVLQLIAEGFATKQIAAELGISNKTAEKHRQLIMQKLNLHETAGLTRYAISMGLVECKRALEGLGRIRPRDPFDPKCLGESDSRPATEGASRWLVQPQTKRQGSQLVKKENS
jgi:DNA-binding NarL/FixJ family response regulator